jgi:6-phosphofructokinase 1
MVYTPEHGINLDMLRDDVKYLRRRFALDERGKAEGRLIVKNESASKVYTLDVLTKMFKEEGGALFDSRSANLGHTLQGHVPSPIDRARAVRTALACMAFAEQHHARWKTAPHHQRRAGPDSAAAITIQGSGIIWVPVREMLAAADTKLRRPKESWWAKHKELIEALVGRPQIV